MKNKNYLKIEKSQPFFFQSIRSQFTDMPTVRCIIVLNILRMYQKIQSV